MERWHQQGCESPHWSAFPPDLGIPGDAMAIASDRTAPPCCPSAAEHETNSGALPDRHAPSRTAAAPPSCSPAQRWIFTALGLMVGWHLAYEGIAKWLTPGWTSAGYLETASGPMAEMWQRLARSSDWVAWIDGLNIAALVLIGLCLMTGFAQRLAATVGMVLLLTYYSVRPPWTATDVGFASEGHYLLINKTLVEAMVLGLIAATPTSWTFSIWRLVRQSFAKYAAGVSVPASVNHDAPADSPQRRTIVKNLISIPVIGTMAFAIAKQHGWQSHEEDDLRRHVDGNSEPTVKVTQAADLSQLKRPIPAGKIGDIEIGRIICGGNLISGFAHSRDLIYVSQFLKNYFTSNKVLDTFWLCEQCGINTTAVSARPEPVALLQDYWKRGGTMKWIAPVYPQDDDYRSNIDFAIDNGASAAMIMGNVGDRWARAGKYDLMATTIDYIKSRGVPAGLAGHELATVQGAEQHRCGADFYMKTLHCRDYWSWKPEQKKDKLIIDNYSVDNYWERTPEETIQYMESIDKPWIAFKTLAAGAVHPKKGFRYAFENGADFICVGMFDYQIIEDANILTAVLDDPKLNRRRRWIA
ncbi:DoxX family protein [Crateriforma conspicua]|nr:DoxX family protein [Crateriforma conspicua]